VRLKIPSAWLAAVIFAVHPVCVASVAWIAERKNTLSLVFFLWSLLWYLRFEEQSRAADNRSASKRYWCSLVLFLLALLSKTSVVMMPFVLMACTGWMRRENATPFRLNLSFALRFLPFLSLSIGLGLVTVWFQTNRAIGGQLYENDSLFMRLLGGTWAIWFYIAKALWPVKLTMVYPRWTIDPSQFITYLPIAVLIILLLVCWKFRSRWGGSILFGLGCFLMLILPVLGFFQVYFFNYSRVADHWQYAAIIGIIALVVGSVGARFQNSDFRFQIGATVVVAFLSFLTWKQASLYQRSETLWRDNVAKNPKAWVAWHNLGTVTTNGLEALQCFSTALAINPRYAPSHNNIGAIYLSQGSLPEAEKHFRDAARLEPDYAAVRNNLGYVLLEQGKLDEAMTELNKAVNLEPDYADAHNNLGRAIIRQGNKAQAVAEFAQALRIDPNHAGANYNMGVALWSDGKAPAAIEHYLRSLHADPNFADAHYQLALALTRSDRTSEVIDHLRLAIQLKPQWVEALNNLAWILATDKHPNFRNGKEALALADRAVTLTQEKSAGALDTLAAAQATNGRFADAIKTIEKAIRVASEDGEKELLQQIQARLTLYQKNEPFRE
jgi:tetratricopeptide (TPR) repeat protein